MNKTQKELVNKCKEISYGKALSQKYDGIYFVPLKQKHDSGYNLLQVIGEIRHKVEDYEYYIIDYCDVIDFESYYEPCNPIRDLHIDCKNGVYHIWSNRQKMIPQYLVSNAVFKMDKLDSLGDKYG